MRTGVPCNGNRIFPVGIDLQGFPVSITGFGFAVHDNIFFRNANRAKTSPNLILSSIKIAHHVTYVYMITLPGAKSGYCSKMKMNGKK